MHRMQSRTLLVKCNQALGNSLSDSVRLGHATSTLHTQSNIHVRETLLSEQQDWLHHFPAQGVWLKQFQRSSVQSDLALTTLHVGHGHGGFLHIGTKDTNQYLIISLLGLYIETYMTKARQKADAASAAAFSNPFLVVTIRTLRPNVCTDCISYKEKITLDTSSACPRDKSRQFKALSSRPSRTAPEQRRQVFLNVAVQHTTYLDHDDSTEFF